MINEAELQKQIEEKREEATVIIGKAHLVRRFLGKGFIEPHYSEGNLKLDFHHDSINGCHGERVQWKNKTVFQSYGSWSTNTYVDTYIPSEDWLRLLEILYEKVLQMQMEKTQEDLINTAKKLGINQ